MPRKLSPMLSIAAVIVSIVMLSACGNRGPLYLPDDSDQAGSEATSVTSQREEDDEESDEDVDGSRGWQ